jgi:hypothetical protein
MIDTNPHSNSQNQNPKAHRKMKKIIPFLLALFLTLSMSAGTSFGIRKTSELNGNVIQVDRLYDSYFLTVVIPYGPYNDVSDFKGVLISELDYTLKDQLLAYAKDAIRLAERAEKENLNDKKVNDNNNENDNDNNNNNNEIKTNKENEIETNNNKIKEEKETNDDEKNKDLNEEKETKNEQKEDFNEEEEFNEEENEKDLNEKMQIAYQKTKENKYHSEAWTILLGELNQEMNIENARPFYEKFLEIYPTASKFWVMYIEHELKFENFNRVEQLFKRCLTNCLHCDLWNCYLSYLKKCKTQQDIGQALRLSTQIVGLDMNSDGIWMDYIHFLKSKYCLWRTAIRLYL